MTPAEGGGTESFARPICSLLVILLANPASPVVIVAKRGSPRMADFATFIDEMPGLTGDARRIYLMIDAEAVRVGGKLAATHDPAVLRARTGSPWLVEHCREFADALETDVRLAAIGALRAWAAQPDGIGNTWINWYVRLLKAHIAHEAAPTLAEAAE